MYRDKKVIVVMPAYNAGKTLERTYAEVMAQDYVDQVILVDDASTDETTRIAADLSRVTVHRHERNRGYGANQKTCYRLALAAGADIVIMVHPDYQYTPKLIPAMTSMIGNGLYHCVVASRILGGQALAGGMPLWRYVSNRFLTLTQNVLMGAKLSEYHTGYRAFSRTVLASLPLEENDDDFVFDNQMLVQAIRFGYRIAEVTCPTRYFADASSISFRRSVIYGLGVLGTAAAFQLHKRGIHTARFLREDGRRIELEPAPDVNTRKTG